MKGGAAEARLRGELARLRPLNPFEVLGIAPTATAEVVRAAFLAATKRFHPNLFGRESAEVQELATEVFLVIRRAYAQLADDDKRRAQREKLAISLAGPGPHPALTFAPAAPLSSTPPRGMPPSPPPQSTTPAPQRPVAPAGARTTPPTQPPSGPAPSRVAPPTPRAVKSVSPAPAQKSRVGSSTDVQAILDAAKGRGGRFEQANRLIAETRYREAREILQKIAAEDPQNRRFRVRLQLAWGLEYRAERKFDEAVRELERALGLDPDNAEVAEALRKTRELRDASRGLISKLFGR